MSSKSIELQPQTSHYFWRYITGILLIPLMGLGIYIIYRLVKKQSGIRYSITNHDISIIDADETNHIPISEIEEINLIQSWTDRKFKTGTLVIQTESGSEHRLVGLENPAALRELLLKAAHLEKERLKKAQVKNDVVKNAPTLHLDKLDYLTGLWQQGLISDDDYKREKKHFE